MRKHTVIQPLNLQEAILRGPPPPLQDAGCRYQGLRHHRVPCGPCGDPHRVWGRKKCPHRVWGHRVWAGAPQGVGQGAPQGVSPQGLDKEPHRVWAPQGSLRKFGDHFRNRNRRFCLCRQDVIVKKSPAALKKTSPIIVITISSD